MEQATRKRSLFDIGDDLVAIEQLMEERDGDISDPEVQATLEQWIASGEGELSWKADRYATFWQKQEAEAAAAKAMMEQYKMAAQVRENRAAALKKRFQEFMVAMGRDSVDTESGRKLCLQKNGGVEPMPINEVVVIAALECYCAVPARTDVKVPTGIVDASSEMAPFIKVTLSLDNAKVREHLKAGGKLCFAELQERGKHIRIR
jgi:hypothetical protein